MKVSVLIRQLAESMKAYVDKQTTTLNEQIKSLPTPRDGRDGIDGKSLTLDEVRPLVAEAVASIPAPKDGINGIDGKSVTIDDVKPLIDEAVKAIPTPKDGRDGIDGKSFTAEEAQELIKKAVEDKQHEWALDFERRAQELFQRAIERIPIPKDGKDGRNAIDVEGFDLTLDGRDLTISLKRDDAVVASKSIRIPAVEYLGVFKEGFDHMYQKGDAVTFGGSLWIAEKDNPVGKPEQSPDWKLAVKRGRDGKEVVRIPRNPDEPVKIT